MKIKFRKARLGKASLARLALVNEIISEYQAAGYTLTLRQLYYQLVSRDIIPNIDREYAKLSSLLREGRMGGLVDWDAIEDRLRKPSKPPSWKNPASILDACIYSYEKDRQKGQPIYTEVWVEKDALSGVLRRVTEKYHINIMVNRGYSSASAMHDAFRRFLTNGAYKERPSQVIYLGDFDPSGLDMIRDIEERINEFIEGSDEAAGIDFQFSVKPIALTMEQIETYNPPPNPAKITDSRAKEFISKYGRTSWEVDALRPDVLHTLLEDAILEDMNMDLYESVLEEEEEDKAKLIELKEQL